MLENIVIELYSNACVCVYVLLPIKKIRIQNKSYPMDEKKNRKFKYEKASKSE